jgi:hypothetical protein
VLDHCRAAHIGRRRQCAKVSTMKIYAYSSQKDPDVLGFTSDITGRNLPGKYAPWRSSNAGATIVTGGGDDPVSVAVQGVGYFIARDRSVQ